MVFLDINTFFSPKAGGIRTYHQAKIAWFKDRPGHRYHLIFPGPAHRVRDEGAARLEEVFGPAMTADPSGYRLLLDFPRVLYAIRASRPAVVEAGDPWLTGLFCLLLRRLGLFRGLLVSFYHSDPVPSYLVPWSERGPARTFKRLLVRMVAPVFYRLQRGYDLTAVSSRTMEASLRARGVRRIAYLPFGVAGLFLEPLPARRPPGEGSAAEIRLLYSGRLDREKGVDLLLDILPDLLAPQSPGGPAGSVSVSVAGRGAYAERFARFEHPRYRYLGFLEGAAQVRDACDAHHILLAPGPFETFGLGVLEGMARGLLVVGPDRGGTGELLREAGSPFLFRADDAADFLRAVRAAIAAAEAGSRYAAEARRSRELAERYGTWDDAVARQIERYAAEAQGGAAADAAAGTVESAGSAGAVGTSGTAGTAGKGAA